MIAEATHYQQGDLILQVRQKSIRTRRQCSQSSSNVGCCGKTKKACKHLGGFCLSKGKSCNGKVISGCQYCKCCVPKGPNDVIPTTEVPVTEAPRRRPPRKPTSCTGSWNGLEYPGQCKLEVPTGMVETYNHDCMNGISKRSTGSGYKCCIEEPLKHCNISGTPYKSG